MKNKSEIENYDEKYKFLKDNGWTDLWHEDNWVQEDWVHDPKLNVDHMGMTMDNAYVICKKTRQRFVLD